MRVYFTGSASLGKTTLCRYVSEKYDLPMLPELARMVLAEKELNIDTLRVNLNAVDDYQDIVLTRQFEEEKNILNSFLIEVLMRWHILPNIQEF